MPFAGYKDFDDCVRRNRNKRDPKAYCATIMRQVEGGERRSTMKPFQFKKFIPISKIDDEQKMVYGYASTPDLDSDGEIIKIEAFEKALPSYMQFPTIREMHQLKAVGTTKNAEIRNEKKDKGLYIGAKIVTEEAWNLIKEGVYKGFSIGGDVLRRVGNVIHELELVEISLVDVPANKQAKIEVWKKERTSKNASTVIILSELLMHVQSIIANYDYMGKKTGKLKRMLEDIKSFIASEASEEESEESSHNGIFTSESLPVLQKKITVLEKMDFSLNPLANSLRKGVIVAMKQKALELKKLDDPKNGEEKAEETPSEEPKEEDAQETKEEVPSSEEKKEEETKEEETPSEETKESGADTTLQKLSEIDKKLNKLSPKDNNDMERVTLSKTVSSLAGKLSKMADILISMEERLAKVEDTPAAPKSRSAVVYKSDADRSEKTALDKKGNNSSELEAKKARLKELDSLYNSVGRAAFAKLGYSMEAQRLESEIVNLEQKARG